MIAFAFCINFSLNRSNCKISFSSKRSKSLLSNFSHSKSIRSVTGFAAGKRYSRTLRRSDRSGTRSNKPCRIRLSTACETFPLDNSRYSEMSPAVFIFGLLCKKLTTFTSRSVNPNPAQIFFKTPSYAFEMQRMHVKRSMVFNAVVLPVPCIDRISQTGSLFSCADRTQKAAPRFLIVVNIIVSFKTIIVHGIGLSSKSFYRPAISHIFHKRFPQMGIKKERPSPASLFSCRRRTIFTRAAAPSI